MAKANLKKKLQFWGTGRRKKAIARVRLIPSGSGAIVINDRSLEDYFPMGTLQYIVKQPLVEVAAEGKYDIFVNVIGGGYTGQARDVLMCVIKKREITSLRKIVKTVDPNAFFIVTDAKDVFGNGFGNINEE